MKKNNRCKHHIAGIVEFLPGLKQFRQQFAMGEVILSQHSPWPAGLTQPLDITCPSGDVLSLSTAIHLSYTSDGRIPLCGAQVRYTIKRGDACHTQLYSILGGIIAISGSLYGLTTAHSIVECLRLPNPELESTSDSAKESDGSSASDLETSSDLEDTPTTVLYSNPKHKSEWMEVPMPGDLVYMGWGWDGDRFGSRGNPDDTSDFALIEVGSGSRAVNGFYDSNSDSIIQISGHYGKNELEEGEVQIITDSTRGPVNGYLLNGDARVILPDRVVFTRRIQIDFQARK